MFPSVLVLAIPAQSPASVQLDIELVVVTPRPVYVHAVRVVGIPCKLIKFTTYLHQKER